MVGTERWARLAPMAVLLGWATATGALVVASAFEGIVDAGRDYWLYMDRAESWLAGNGFYLPHQLAGPYTVTMGDATYPPVALILFVPFTMLPTLAWWAVPAAISVAALRRIRPSGWGIVLLAAAVAYPRTWDLVIAGNPAIWSFAFLLAGLSWGFPGPFTALKLTLVPFAIAGIRHPASSMVDRRSGGPRAVSPVRGHVA